jgi:hypothetical protein
LGDQAAVFGFSFRDLARSCVQSVTREKGPSRMWRPSSCRKTRDGLTTKILALVDALGDLARFVLLPGQRHSSVGVAPLIEGIGIVALIGDIGFANDWLRKELDDHGALAVIPPKKDRKTNIPCDFAMDRWRHLIKTFFATLRRLSHQAALAGTRSRNTLRKMARQTADALWGPSNSPDFAPIECLNYFRDAGYGST